MATTKAPVKKSSSAVKRSRQGEIRHARNTSVLSRLKTDEKKLRAAFETNVDEAKTLYQNFTSALDKAAKTNVLKKNTSSRLKSRLAVKVSALTK